MLPSRIENSIRNIKIGYFCKIAVGIFAFLNRTLLINCLGTNYAGISGLFTEVLGILSFSELGIGLALNYRLYEPIAKNDKETIKSLMLFYGKAYRIIALVILTLGLMIIPFLDNIVKRVDNVGNIHVYYLIYLINTVISYFLSYKINYINALQENYIVSIIDSTCAIITYIFQIISIYTTKNFTIYLLCLLCVSILHKFFANLYINKRYPLLVEANIKPLNKKVKNLIKKDVSAIIFLNLGNVAVHQTDNIIISSFVDISIVGKVTYYLAFFNISKGIISTAMNSIVGSIGNALQSVSKSSQKLIYHRCLFITCWLHGIFSICMFLILPDIISFLVGSENHIEIAAFALITIDFYTLGERTITNNFRLNGGIFEQGKYVAILCAVINLVTSIHFVRIIGLTGVYVGTILAALVSEIVNAYVLYKYVFNSSVLDYYLLICKYFIATFLAFCVCLVINSLFSRLNLIFILIKSILLLVFVNLFWVILFYKSDDFKYFKNILTNRFKTYKAFRKYYDKKN